MPGGGKHGRDSLSVQTTGVPVPLQRLRGCLRTELPHEAVGPRSSLGRPRRRKNLALRGETGGARAAIITRTVAALVMLSDDRTEPRQGRRARQHPLAVLGIQARSHSLSERLLGLAQMCADTATWPMSCSRPVEDRRPPGHPGRDRPARPGTGPGDTDREG